MSKINQHPNEGYPFDYYGDHAVFVDDRFPEGSGEFRIEFSEDMTEEQRQAICALMSAAPKLLAIAKEVADIPTARETPGIAARDDQMDELIIDARTAAKDAEMFSDTAPDEAPGLSDDEIALARITELEADRDGWGLHGPEGEFEPDPEDWREENPDEAAELDALYERFSATKESPTLKRMAAHPATRAKTPGM